MLSLKAFTAYVECDGEKLEEYDVQVKDDVVTCWIESKVGKKFKIIIANTDENKDSVCEAYMDGKRLRCPIVYRTKSRVLDGLHVDSTTVKPFMFCPLELTDDDNLLHTTGVAEKLGQIDLQFFHVLVDRTPGEPWVSNQCDGVSNGPVHERTKKLASHRIGVSSETIQLPASERLINRSSQPLDPANPGPVATLCFKYRPREFLEAQGFVEPVRRVESSPTPEPIPRSRNPSHSQGPSSRKKRRRTTGAENKENIRVKEEDEELDDEEEDNDDEEIRHLEAELEMRRLKQKRRRTGVKKEPKPDPDTIIPLVIGEDGVIDLTRD